MKAFLSPYGRRPRLMYWRAAALVPLFGLFGMIVTTIGLRRFVRLLPATYGTAVSVSALVFVAVFVLAFWAGLAVAIQRLHDRDRSGWWVLIALVPVAGSLWYLLWNGLRPGTPGPNRFGPDPLAPDAAVIAVFDDGAVPRRPRRPIASTIAAWTVLLAILAFDGIMLFQAPGRHPPRPAAMPSQPIQR